jgi:hypothetical protein
MSIPAAIEFPVEKTNLRWKCVVRPHEHARHQCRVAAEGSDG